MISNYQEVSNAGSNRTVSRELLAKSVAESSEVLKMRYYVVQLLDRGGTGGSGRLILW